MNMCPSPQLHATTGRLSRLAKAATAIVMLAFTTVGLVGCNAGGNNLLEANRALQERVTALQADNESLHNTNQQLQAALSARDKAMLEMQAQLDTMLANGQGMDSKYNDMLKRLQSMKFGSLDPETNAALAELAAQHPDLLEYDPVSGVLRFKSDFTFSSGSDEVNSAAKSTLQQLAGILNGAAASYDIKVLGHTDTQPIRRVANRHPTNMHLSAHRAISVRSELVSMGVAAQRFEVAGRGEFDPLVQNNPDGNTARNRRVEIYLTKSVGRAPVSAPTESAPTHAPAKATPAPKAKPAPNEGIMK